MPSSLLAVVLYVAAATNAAEPPNPAHVPAYVFVGGEVKAPGRFPWTNGMRLTDSIERAGGYTVYADLTQMRITRLETNVILCDYRAAAASPAKNPTISAGDVVQVPRGQVREAVRAAGRKLNLNLDLPQPLPGNTRFIEVEGEVERPGRFPWTNGMTLSVLIHLAGGLTRQADSARIKLYFQGGVDNWSYAKATNSPRWDPPVGGGARIVVPHMTQTNQSSQIEQSHAR
jgi:protein involved in polysaccharide export with SLBB domain